jgi:hypothetical protein
MGFNRIGLNQTSPNQSHQKDKAKGKAAISDKKQMKLAIPEAIHDQKKQEKAQQQQANEHGSLAGVKATAASNYNSSNQIKKPPQVPSLKILQAQR